MSAQLDREGIFKVRPVSWRVKTFPSSKSVAIAIEFVVVAQLDEESAADKTYTWQDWTVYDEIRVWGDYWVVKKDGQPNVGTCEQLAEAMGWRGSLKAVQAGPPPQCIVQVTVKSEDYQGKTYYKAAWMNPEDYVPTSGGAPAEEVDALEASFGSLLRAATSGKASPPKKAQPPTRAVAPKPVASQPEAGPGKTEPNYGDIPF